MPYFQLNEKAANDFVLRGHRGSMRKIYAIFIMATVVLSLQSRLAFADTIAQWEQKFLDAIISGKVEANPWGFVPLSEQGEIGEKKRIIFNKVEGIVESEKHQKWSETYYASKVRMRVENWAWDQFNEFTDGDLEFIATLHTYASGYLTTCIELDLEYGGVYSKALIHSKAMSIGLEEKTNIISNEHYFTATIYGFGEGLNEGAELLIQNKVDWANKCAEFRNFFSLDNVQSTSPKPLYDSIFSSKREVSKILVGF